MGEQSEQAIVKYMLSQAPGVSDATMVALFSKRIFKNNRRCHVKIEKKAASS